jgi:hypothetical protein
MEPTPVRGALLEPAERAGQCLPEDGDGEVVGAQQLVDERVVGGQPGCPAPDEPAAFAQFVGEPSRVGAHGGVGDQPALHLAPLGAEGRQSADDTV